MVRCGMFVFFNDTATTEIYTLSLHDALPIFRKLRKLACTRQSVQGAVLQVGDLERMKKVHWILTGLSLSIVRSEEHTSELQSRQYLVCRLLLEKKKTQLLPRFSSASSSTPTS